MSKFGAGGVALAAGLSSGDKNLELFGGTALAASVLGDMGISIAKGASDVLKAAAAPDGALQTLVKAGLGWAINPVIEVLYNSPSLRTYQFTFIFAPRSSEEADAVYQIINLFRYHQAPEFKSGGRAIDGAFFVPPSEFDITFLMKSQNGSGFVQNTNIPSADTVVLTSCVVNYAKAGEWVTFDDGFPVMIEMILDFNELDIMTRDRIARGF